jgi:hypothetical protein
VIRSNGRRLIFALALNDTPSEIPATGTVPLSELRYLRLPRHNEMNTNVTEIIARAASV